MSQRGPELSEQSEEVLVAFEQIAPWLTTSPLLQELQARAAIGRKTYGVPLCTHNGRDVAQDEREEVLDALAYAMQDALEARDAEDYNREAKAWRRVGTYTDLLYCGWVER